MDHERSFQCMAAITAVLSMPLAFGNTLTMLLALDFDVDAVLNPPALLVSGPFGAHMWRWSMVLDLLGYYLLIVPLIVPPAVTGIAQPGLAWTVLPGPPWWRSDPYGHASAADPCVRRGQRRAAGHLECGLLTLVDAVMVGLWNMLEMLLASMGWFGFGTLLIRERRGSGVVTLLQGFSALIDVIGVIFGIAPLAAGLMVYLFLAPIWAFWLGLDLLRRPVQFTDRVHTDDRSPTSG